MIKTRHATAVIIDGRSTIRIDIDISGITQNNAKIIFERIGLACRPHMQVGSRLETVYFWEDVRK